MHLDQRGYAKVSDNLFKYALDVSKLEGDYLGSGYYGSVFSNIPKDDVLKSVGREHDLVVKRFNDKKNLDNVCEWVVAQVIAPVVNKYSSVQMPDAPKQSFFNFLTNGILLSRRIIGKDIYAIRDMFENKFGADTFGASGHYFCRIVEAELLSHGVMWYDCSYSNAMMGPSLFKEFNEQMTKLNQEEMTQWLKNNFNRVHIVDLGSIFVNRDSPPGDALDNFKSSVLLLKNKYPKVWHLDILLSAINEIFINEKPI